MKISSLAILCSALSPSLAWAFVPMQSQWDPSSLPVGYRINLNSAPPEIGSAGARTAVAAQARRAGARRVYGFEGWRVDAARREVTSPSGVLISLTSGEFDLLMALLEHPQMVLTRDHLVELTRQRGSDGMDRSIDILVSRIRRKVEDNPKSPSIIKTVRGGGYLFAPQVTLGT